MLKRKFLYAPYFESINGLSAKGQENIMDDNFAQKTRSEKIQEKFQVDRIESISTSEINNDINHLASSSHYKDNKAIIQTLALLNEKNNRFIEKVESRNTILQWIVIGIGLVNIVVVLFC